jgi:hypothetical protein
MFCLQYKNVIDGLQIKAASVLIPSSPSRDNNIDIAGRGSSQASVPRPPGFLEQIKSKERRKYTKYL